MAYKITIANSKGGVGKTTITAMIGYIFAEKGKRVLLVDVDPQSNLTQIMTKTFYGNDKVEYEATLYDGIVGKDLRRSIHELSDQLHLIPSGYLDTAKIRTLFNESNRYTLLKKHIAKFEDEYDYIFFDVPPTFTTEFIENALTASDYFIVLSEASPFSLEGSGKFWDVAEEIHENLNPNLDCLGILINMREDNKKLLSMLDAEYDFSNTENFFENYFPRRERIAGYAAYGLFKRDIVVKSLIRYDVHDKRLMKLTHKVVDEITDRIQADEKAKGKEVAR